MEMGERVLEGGHIHWNPGIGPGPSVTQQQGPQQGDVVWPPMQSAECLMNTTSGNDVSMFDGYPLILSSSDGSQHRLTEFRHRFPHPAMHFSSSSSVVGGIGHSHHDNLALSIPSHPLGDVSESEGNNSSGQVQEGLEMERGHHHGLEDCSEECSDDEDEEEESDEEIGIEGSGYVHHNQAMSLDQENALPSCQQQHSRQLRVINSNGDVNLMGSNMDDPSCHQKNGMMSHVHEIEEDIPPISQGHPLNSNPISEIPMIGTGNCSSMMMSDDQEAVVGGNGNTSANPMNMGINGDPSSCNSNGQSVHGKMYVEERVVFHLKQWTDSGFGHFNSCREQNQKDQYRCAVCHIRSPHNTIPQKDSHHRHLVRGILFSFEDCIILELYPEDYTDGQEPRSDHQMSMDPKQIIHMENTKTDESVPLSYFNTSSTSIPNIVLTGHEPHSMEKPSVIAHDHNGGWWEYESERDVVERHDNIAHHVPPESCSINMKLTAQQYHDAQTATARDETEMEEIGEVQIEIQTENDSDIDENEQDKEFRNYHDPQLKFDSAPPQYYSDTAANQNQEISSSQQCPTDGIQPSLIPTHLPVSEGLEHLTETSNKSDIPILPNSEQDIMHNENQNDKKPPDKKSTKKKQSNSSNKYPCPCCNEHFSLKRLLKDHLEENHHAGNPFQCTLCKMQYADTKRLQKHSCTLSVETIKHRLKIKEAKELEKNESESVCNIQNNLTVLHSEDTIAQPDGELEILELVMASKSSKIRKFSEKASLKSRIRESEKADSSISSATDSNLSIVEQHSNESRVSCEDEENNLINDRETQPKSSKFNSTPIKVNQDQNLNKPCTTTTKSKEFRCKVCGKSFSHYRSLINHGTCHKTEKRSQCDKCGKSFARRDKLMRHMYVHSEEKMFPCDICDKKFSRRDKLSDHLKSHQTGEIHNCTMCERQFLRPDILKQHVKMHQMDDKHQCPECLRFVTGKERLDQHMKRHEEAKALGQTLLCPLCTKYFIQTQSLKAHIRKFHRDALSQLNMHQFNLICSSSDAKKLVQDINISNQRTGSPTNSTCSSDSTSPIPSIVPKKSTTPVCQVLENVMNSTKSKFKPTPIPIKPEVKYSCAKCPKTFSRTQTLKSHELRQHSEQNIPTTTTASDKNTEEPVCNLRKKKSSKIKEPDVIKPAIPKNVKFKNKSITSIKKSKKIMKSKPARIELGTAPSLQTQQTLTLPSCTSITHDLGFNLNNTTPTFQQPQLSAYSHQLALNMVGRSGINMQNMAQLQSPLPLDSVVVSSGHLPLQHSQLSSLQLINSHGPPGIGQSLSPTSAFVINYPSNTTMSFLNQ